MKKILVILLTIAFNVFAQGEGDRIVNPFWKLASGVLSPTVSTWTLTLPATTFSPSIVTPLIIGGADTISTLTYKTTTGVGKTGARHIFQVGNNGATEAMTILNSGFVGIGKTPSYKLDVNGDIHTTSTVYGQTGLQSNAITTYTNQDLILQGRTSYGVNIKYNGGTSGIYLKNDGKVGVGTSTPYAQYSQVGATPIWYATDSDFNLHRTSLATATDTAGIKIDASVAQPIITVKNTIGNGFALTTVAAGGAVFDGALTAPYILGTAYVSTPLIMGPSTIFHIRNNTNTQRWIDFKATGDIQLLNTIYSDSSTGNVGLGVTTFPTTLAKGLTIANGTAPTVKANSASLYVVSGEMWVYDSTGTATQISPHNKDGDWVFDSYNTETGERTYINMITLAETLEVLSGKTLIVRDNVLQEVQKKDAYEEYDSTITINKKVMEDEATSLVIDTVYSEIADTTQLVEYYTYDDKTKKVEKKTKYKIDKVPNYVSEWKIKDGYKLNETNGDFEKTTSTKKANRLKSNAKIKDGKYYIINLARQ